MGPRVEDPVILSDEFFACVSGDLDERVVGINDLPRGVCLSDDVVLSDRGDLGRERRIGFEEILAEGADGFDCGDLGR